MTTETYYDNPHTKRGPSSSESILMKVLKDLNIHDFVYDKPLLEIPSGDKNHCYRYDFCFEYYECKWVVEADGEQHFEKDSIFYGEGLTATFEKTRHNDIAKTKLAAEYGYHMIRIDYTHRCYENILFHLEQAFEYKKELYVSNVEMYNWLSGSVGPKCSPPKDVAQYAEKNRLNRLKKNKELREGGSTEYLEACRKSMSVSLSGLHEDVVSAIILHEFSEDVKFCGLQKDTHTACYYRRDYIKNVWKRASSDVLETQCYSSYIMRLEHWKSALISEKNGYETTSRANQEMAMAAVQKITGGKGLLRPAVISSRKISTGVDVEKIIGSALTNAGATTVAELEAKIKKIFTLIAKLKTYGYRRCLWNLLSKTVARDIINMPVHIDQSGPIDFYNIFPGFIATKVEVPIELTPNNPLQRLLTHINIVWARRDPYRYRYSLSWLAHPILYLLRTNVAMVLIGLQGSGKSMILEFLSEFVYGPHLSDLVDNFEPILQRFNDILAGKMLISIDDTKNNDGRKFVADFNKFKPKITGNTTQIEAKGKSIVKVTNYNSFAICSNHDIPVKIEEGDRRYVVLDCSDELIKDQDYFTSIHADCFNQETGNLFYSYVRSKEFQNILVPLLPVPMTEAKDAILETMRPKHLNFLDAVFVQGEYSVPSNILHIEEGLPIICPNDLYKQYVQWCIAEGNKCTYKLAGFSKKLHECPGLIYSGNRKFSHTEGMKRYFTIDKYQDTMYIRTRSNTNITLREYVGRKRRSVETNAEPSSVATYAGL